MAKQVKGVIAQVSPDVLALVEYWNELEAIYGMMRQAQAQVERTIGTPICVESCGGHCCTINSIVAYGFEAEHVASWLLTQGPLMTEILDRARAWLTESGQWTYGRQLTPELWKSLENELVRALMQRCAFLGDNGRCLIHEVRPMVCRTYGVTHMPGSNCPRPLGLGEESDSRAWFDPSTAELPIRPRWNALRRRIKEPRFSRSGFLALMLFERFKAKELAGLLDDGRIPLVKAHQGWGHGLALLWQDDLERDWRAAQADLSIAQSIPIEQRNGRPVMVVRGGKRR